MIKTSKIRRRSVPVHVSRIRRDPALAPKPLDSNRNAWWESREWEVRLAVIGIVFFTLAISAAVIDIGAIFSH